MSARLSLAIVLTSLVSLTALASQPPANRAKPAPAPTPSPAPLGRCIGQTSPLCIGNRVIDASGDVGSVDSFVNKDLARVTLLSSGASVTRKTSELASEVRCMHGICEGDRTMDTTGHLGTAIWVFEDGMAKVRIDSWPGLYTQDTAKISRR